MSKLLFEVQQKNRLQQKGLLRRFSITCYGHQESVEEMRAHKAEMYRKLKASKNKEEFEEWFLNYKPDDLKMKAQQGKKQETNNSKTKKTNKNKKPKKKSDKGLFAIFKNKTRKNKKDLY